MRSVEHGLVSEELRQSFFVVGAEGEIGGHYLTVDRDTVDRAVADLIAAQPIDDLLAIPDLALASGMTRRCPRSR